MLLLEEKNHGWWHSREQQISHYTGLMAIFSQKERMLDRKGYHDLAANMRKARKDAKRELQRVLSVPMKSQKIV